MKRQKFSEITFGEYKVSAEDWLSGPSPDFQALVEQAKLYAEEKANQEAKQPLRDLAPAPTKLSRSEALEDFRREHLADLEERRQFKERDLLCNRLARLNDMRKYAFVRGQMAEEGLRQEAKNASHPDLDCVFHDIWQNDLQALSHEIACLDNEILYVQEQLSKLNQ